MSRISMLILSSIVVLSFYLSACSFWGNDIPTAEMNIHSAQYLNPDVNGRASPVVLIIFQLKNQSTFKGAYYSALAGNSEQVLGGDLLDKNIVEIRPNTHMHISQSLTTDTKYIGVIASYRNIDKATWRKVVVINNGKKKTTKIDIDLASEALNVSVKK